jgi:hypothetical protein
VAWLRELQAAVAARHDVAAIVYQEAGPVSDLSGKDAKPWALTADQQTVAQFRKLATALGTVDNK